MDRNMNKALPSSKLIDIKKTKYCYYCLSIVDHVSAALHILKARGKKCVSHHENIPIQF